MGGRNLWPWSLWKHSFLVQFEGENRMQANKIHDVFISTTNNDATFHKTKKQFLLPHMFLDVCLNKCLGSESGNRKWRIVSLSSKLQKFNKKEVNRES